MTVNRDINCSLMSVLYDLSDSDAIGNGADDILTAFKDCSRHVSYFGSSDLINRSLKRFRLASVTFRLSPSTNGRTVLVVPSFDHHPIGNRQPHFVMTADMLLRAYHDSTYGLTCQFATSITSVRLCPAW
ncbi:hypothetical protein AMTR_s00074p00168990 [Amborella trichopoda]|uniref:Uncharacterized protein n=1 Tax=Amborella trichopoda TaxID=13333 RepID=W1NQA2_AMBTC|nr:hypothetical protein AMTR_s00074p00168990 [Amborella trichopoda]